MVGARGVPPQDDAPGAELLQLPAMAARLGRQDPREALRIVTDASVHLTGAEYRTLLYSVEDQHGGRLDLYVLAGAFPDEVSVGHTALFAPTFSGRGVARVADVVIADDKDRRAGGHRPSGGRGHGQDTWANAYRVAAGSTSQGAPASVSWLVSRSIRWDQSSPGQW